MLGKKRIAVVGTGKLGETLIRALLEAKVVKPSQVVAADPVREAIERKSEALGVRGTTNNAEAVRGADLVILAVKPQIMDEAVRSISKVVGPKQVVVSVAASVTTAAIERRLKSGVPVVRTMPNTPCLLRCGMTGICAGKNAKREHVSLAEEVFSSFGRVLVLDERYLDAVTGLSGSGPAFMYVMLEALAEGGVKVGLPRDIATELVAQTMLGAATMVLETREHPAKLKEVVTTPAGCTIDGLLELEAGGLRVTLINAVVKAARRASELSKG